jgi:S-adenosylmethionine-diacylglycerol 3-amino-3-carboxypropyl transferase
MAVTSEFVTEASHEVVRYSQVWEDHRLLEAGLRLAPGQDVLTIASAGDNVLALLLAEPRRIVAIDVSPAQRALTELKLVAVRELPAEQLPGFLGARPCRDRSRLYAQLAPALSLPTRAYWGRNREALRLGVLGTGLLERYVAAFADGPLRAAVQPDAIRRLLDSDDLEFQRHLFQTRFAGLEHAVRVFFGRAGLSGRALDVSQLRFAGNIDVGGAIWERLRRVATELPARGNHYLEWLLTGSYRDIELGPAYLRPANIERLRGLVDRVQLVQEDVSHHLESQAPESFDALNLSDVLEYLDEDAAAELLHHAATRLRPGGRLAYWNLLVDRSAAGLQAGDLESLQAEADTLHAGDRVPFYGAFRLEQRPHP